MIVAQPLWLTRTMFHVTELLSSIRNVPLSDVATSAVRNEALVARKMHMALFSIPFGEDRCQSLLSDSWQSLPNRSYPGNGGGIVPPSVGQTQTPRPDRSYHPVDEPSSVAVPGLQICLANGMDGAPPFEFLDKF
ncbi:hypothetical protein AVEN_18709-1 [Araneus ventricosus]|uniref:Uncharacterized protein n=1 Tax=Araneus ventricosus TaxID=182803 RepID=A0A4Y2U7H5_ARAVE|nr:hypothetical protein AVEN_18709-1 [Araneus ventricosus]